jgi:hypothetical protein
MSEAITAFQYISDNVPSWITTLDALDSIAKKKHANISRVPIPTRKLQKPGSSQSIRPITGSDECHHLDSLASAPQPADIINAPMNDDLVNNPRKRKTVSILSTESMPSKFRSRSMIIVYYDSEIQKGFEQIVRDIGQARYHLRKARTSSRMDTISMGHHIPGSPLTYRSTRDSPNVQDKPASDSPDKGSDLFSSIDASLDLAQELCERGAHQFLREGDFSNEIEGAKRNFSNAKKHSDTELARLRAEPEAPVQPKVEELKVEQDGFIGDPNTGLLEADDGSDDDMNDMVFNIQNRHGIRSTRTMDLGRT